MLYRPRVMLRRTAALLLLALAAAPAAHAAGPPIMALSDVRAGMVCTVASVIHGTAISTLRRARRRRHRAGVRSGDRAHPRDGLRAGDRRHGRRPRVLRLADHLPGRGRDAAHRRRDHRDDRRLRRQDRARDADPGDPRRAGRPAARRRRTARAPPRCCAAPARISEPLSYSGLSPAVGRVFQRAAARAGRTLVLAPLRPAQAPAAPAIVPGSAIGVTLATGDVDAGAVGTAAYVDGTHGLGLRASVRRRRQALAVPDRGLRLRRRQQPARDRGLRDLQARRADRHDRHADAGRRQRRRRPARSRAAELPAADRRPRPRHAPADGPALAGRRRARDRPPDRLVRAVGRRARPRSSRRSTARSTARRSGRAATCACGSRSAARKKPLGFCNTYVGGGGSTDALAGGPLVADAAAATQILDAYDAGPLHDHRRAGRPARRARAAHRDAEAPAAARRARAAAARSACARRSRRPGGGTVVRTLRVPVPRGIPRGPRTLFLKGTEADVPQGGVRRRLDDDRSVVAVRARAAATSRRARRRSPRWRARCPACTATTASRRASCRRARRCRRSCPAAPRASRSARAASSATRSCGSRAGRALLITIR